MVNNESERRISVRFEIPEASVSYKVRKFFSFKKSHKEDTCPIEEISRGGIRFLCSNFIRKESNIKIKISIPRENISQIFKGKVKWISVNQDDEYPYRVGVQFNPYGIKKEENHPESLETIIRLEEKFSNNK